MSAGAKQTDSVVKMNFPLIFSHFGYQPYLAYTLAQAKRTNPDRRLIFLGDDQNRNIALTMGWEHFSHDNYSDELHKRFSASYRPIYGPGKRSDHQKNPEEKAWYLRWLRYVTERWFIVNAFVKEFGIDRFWHFDSDTMIVQCLSASEIGLSGIDYTIQCDNACLNGLIRSVVLTEFCDKICTLYEDSTFLERTQAALDTMGTAAGFSEMEAFELFRLTSPRRSVWLMEYRKDLVFDDCLCHAHGFLTVKIKNDKEVKNIFFEDGEAFGWRNNIKTKFATLNLSWLPLHIFMWAFEAQKNKSKTSISDVISDEIFINVNFDSTDKIIELKTNNSHNGYGINSNEPFQVSLRSHFRHSRKKLITFAYGFQYLKQQKAIAGSAVSTGEIDTVENWSYDSLKNTNFFHENKDILRSARGQGFWLWKPYIVSRALEASEDGDLVIYSDCAHNDEKSFARSILPMLLWLSGDTRRFWSAHEPWPNSTLTKRDCFYFMNCDQPAYWGHRQISASYFAFIASVATRELVADWLKFCLDARILTDSSNICKLENLPDFLTHKNDQSVLSNLLIREKFTTPAIRIGAEVKTKNFGDLISFFDDEFKMHKNNFKKSCLSFGKSWTASSGSIWAPSKGVMDKNHEAQEFFFHTSLENNPWWELDLANIFSISEIVILNRPLVPFGARAGRMRIYAGLTDMDMTVIFDAVASDWDPYTPLVLDMGNIPIRIIKISLDTEEILHLKDVRVYGDISR